MLTVNIQNAKSITFGRSNRHKERPDGTYCQVFSLRGEDENGERFQVDCYTDGGTVTPVIDSTITGADGKVVGDWLTDSIDSINLEPSILDSASPADTKEQSDAYKLMSALATATDIVSKHSHRLTKEKAVIILAAFRTAFELSKDIG